MNIDSQEQFQKVEESLVDAPLASSPSSPTNTNKTRYVYVGVLLMVIVAGVVISGVLKNRTVIPESNSSLVATSQPVSPMTSTYTNKFAGYSFQYPNTYGIQWTGSSDDAADSDYIRIAPAQQMNSQVGMTMKIVSSPTTSDSQSESDLVKNNIVSYFASSTAEFPSPENNQVTNIQTDQSPYKFEVSWKDSSSETANQGTQIWLFYALNTPQYPVSARDAIAPQFLWVRYDTSEETALETILQSLEVPRQP